MLLFMEVCAAQRWHFVPHVSMLLSHSRDSSFLIAPSQYHYKFSSLVHTT